MENDIQVKYDSLCYATYANVQHKTKDAERIVLRNFDGKNKEHLFVLALVMACNGILGSRKVATDGDAVTRLGLSRAYKQVGGIAAAKKTENIFVDVPEMLEFMRPHAQELCGEKFSFGDIYDEYYSGKDEE